MNTSAAIWIIRTAHGTIRETQRHEVTQRVAYLTRQGIAFTIEAQA